MGSFSAFHWIVVLAVVLLIFGTGKLRSIGSDLGTAVREFKKNIDDEVPPAAIADASQHASSVSNAEASSPLHKSA